MTPPAFVVDTNVAVAGLITGAARSPVALILDAMLSGSLLLSFVARSAGGVSLGIAEAKTHQIASQISLAASPCIEGLRFALDTLAKVGIVQVVFGNQIDRALEEAL